MIPSYYVKSTGGGMHNFIVSLLYYSHTKNPIFLKWHKDGHAHENMVLRNIIDDVSVTFIGIERLLYTVPEGVKLITIDFDKEDEYALHCNHFYKTVATLYINNNLFDQYRYLYENHKEFFSPTLNTLRELPIENLKILLNEYILKCGSAWASHHRKHFSYDAIFTVKEIYNNKLSVLNKIQELTGMATTAEMDIAYDNYIELQNQLSQKYDFKLPK